MVTIKHLCDLVGLTPDDVNNVTERRTDLVNAVRTWEPEFAAWFGEQSGWNDSAVPTLLEGYLVSFVGGEYGDEFHALHYRQSLHWLHHGVSPAQTIATLSRVRQFLIRVGEKSWGSVRLAQALCRIVDISQAIQGVVAHIEQTLGRLRRGAEQDVARIVRNWSTMLDVDRDELARAYTAHYRWKVCAYSLALGEDMDLDAFPAGEHECELGRWLDATGYARIPEDLRDPLRLSHARLHAVMGIVLNMARRQEPQNIAHYLIDVEAASQEIANVLEACLDGEMQHLAVEDGLTRIGNRRMFNKELGRRRTLSQRSKVGFGLLFIDIDRFKSVNDSHGHVVGDQVLYGVAQYMSSMMRGGDTIYRWGGEEFAALIDAAAPAEVVQAAERLRAEVEVYALPTDIGPIRITISIGGAWCDPKRLAPADELFRRADQRLHIAKNTGRNRVVTSD